MDGVLRVLVVDAQAIFRRGVAACLAALPTVGAVAEAGSVGEARASGLDVDVVLLDPALPAADALMRELRDANGAAVVACMDDEGGLLEAFRAGAVGFLRKRTMTPGTLATAVEATMNGTVVIAPELLRDVLVHGAVAPPRVGATRAGLTTREQDVLALVAEGLPTREVSERLCYSERTVKNVLHDAVTKLGARSRSEAVAHAVRDGLI